MKKAMVTIIVFILLGIVYGCNTPGPMTQSLVPTATADPMEQYERLAGQGDSDATLGLVNALVANGEYTKAGDIVAEEHKEGRMMEYLLLCRMFEGHEDSVALPVWDTQYADTCDRYERAATETIEDRMALMGSYHRILYKHFESTADTLEHALSVKAACFDSNGKLLAPCGTAGKKKALVYINNNNACSISLSMTAALPEAMIPSTLEEAEYVVMLEYTARVVGRYTNGDAARRVDADVSILHYPDMEMLYAGDTVSGGDPPQSIKTTKDSAQGASGSYPSDAEVAKVLASAFQYIKGLSED